MEHLMSGTKEKRSEGGMRDRFLGCLLGGAVGDALGGAVEFMSRAQILDRFGPMGIADFATAYGGKGKITDDTQMTLFTAEGLLRGRMRFVTKGITSYEYSVAAAYQRWLATQGVTNRHCPGPFDGFLYEQSGLHSQRAPGMTCLSALKTYRGDPGIAVNNSKGCGGVMRVGPVGLLWSVLGNREDITSVFEMGKMCAELTHGHPSGYLTAGSLAVIIFAVLDGATLEQAIAQATELLVTYPSHGETLKALDAAVRLSQSNCHPVEAISTLGEGWVAEEALAVALYCTLVSESFEEAIVLAVNHDGDSDSTGAIAGNILGAIHGATVIPERWLESLELRSVIETVASDLWNCRTWTSRSDREDAWARYPGY
jgi:ADP-ribosylglycohydrolase